MSKKHVFYVGGLESNQRGAVGTHTSGVIRGFKENGYHVTGIFLEGGTPFEKCDREIIVPASRANFSPIKVVADRVSLIRAARKIEPHELIYHRYDPLLSPFIVTMNTIIEYNDDVVAQVRFAARNGQWSRAGSRIRLIIYPPLFRLAEMFCFRKSKAVVGVTAELCSFIKSLEPRSKPVHIPNGSSAAYDPDLVQHCSEDKFTLRIAHIGTLTHWDGLIDFLHGIADYRERNPSAALLFRIIGSGNIQKKIQDTVRELGLDDIVRLEPTVSHEDALEILHSVDVVPLLKTINSYGLSPMKYYEALALGCFLICSDIDHINEVPDDSGIVVPFPFTTQDITAALEAAHMRIFEMRSSRPERSRFAQSQHSWQRRIKDLLSYINQSA